jgi:hypothetical protein
MTCFLAFIGSFAVSFLYLKKLSFVFGISVIFPLFLLNPYVDALVQLVSSLLYLIFFVVFRNSMEIEEERMLNKPIMSIILAISFFLFFHVVVLINFLTINKFVWLEHMHRGVAVGTVPLLIIAVLLMLNFYYRFYCLLESNDCNRKMGTLGNNSPC